MRIGIMGGTYNPPHIGHLHAAEMARKHCGLEKLLLVPANIPPHKDLPKNTPSAAHRLAMTRLAAVSIGAEVCDIELNRQGKSYTADTLDELQARFPKDELFFIIGTDMFLTIQDWYQPARIFKAAQLVIVARDIGDEEAICRHAKKLYAMGARVQIVPCKPLPISSTQLRKRIGDEEIKKYLPQGVYDYIREYHLY